MSKDETNETVEEQVEEVQYTSDQIEEMRQKTKEYYESILPNLRLQEETERLNASIAESKLKKFMADGKLAYAVAQAELAAEEAEAQLEKQEEEGEAPEETTPRKLKEE